MRAGNLSGGRRRTPANPIGFGPNLIDDPTVGNPAAWVTSGGWSISGGRAVATNASDSLRKNGVMQDGKFYRLVFNYTCSGGSQLRVVDNTGRLLYVTQTLSGAGTLSGTITCNIAAEGTDLLIQAEGSVFNGTITSMDLRELIYTDSRLGSERVSNGGFGSTAAWSATGGWSISGGVANGAAATNRLAQTGVFVVGKTYRLVIKLRRTGGLGAALLRIRTEAGTNLAMSVPYPSSGGTLRLNGNHVILANVVADGTSLYVEADTAAFTGIVDNISAQEVL